MKKKTNRELTADSKQNNAISHLFYGYLEGKID